MGVVFLVTIPKRRGWGWAKPRHNDPMQMMEKVAAKLSDQDIKDVAAFLTVAVPFTPGNPYEIPREEW